MRVVVTGATGNVGTSVLRALAGEPLVEEVVGLARRSPALRIPKVEWRRADVTGPDLAEHFRGAAAVVHLAWLIQPGRDKATLRATNVDGSARVFEAVAAAKVPALVYASSVGAYGPSPPRDRRRDETWPTTGIETSFYSRHKAEVERTLDRFERENPGVRVSRMRPALIFKRQAGSEIRRLFAGPFLPSPLVKPERLPLLAIPRGLAFQAVHSHCVGEAFRRAIIDPGAAGAFNLAAEPILDRAELGRVLQARVFELPAGLFRAAAAATFKARLQPSEPGWLDMALQVPLMDTARAREVLGWIPQRSSGDALLDLMSGIENSDGVDTPPLSPASGGPLRTREVTSGIGAREGH